MFDFTIHKTATNSLARTGTFTTPHGQIQTPVFMPVGTKASVKTLSQEDLKAIDAEIILANTYHLYLRPGHELIKKMGGLHKWINWDRPILTDSGGFQVFSLGRTENGVKIDDHGVTFKSHIDGSSHYLTPQKAIEIQHDLGADIIMAFDECAPAHSSETYFQQAMQRTHNCLTLCKQTHDKLNPAHQNPRALFGIVQGGLFANLRQESAKFVNDLDLPGNAIGGLSVGESKEEMHAMLEASVPHLSDKKPRYLMGVGTPEDLLEAVDRGVDMFDCVHPTRLARHGGFFTNEGRFNIKNEQFKYDETEIQGYSKSYLRHLFFENEIHAMRILSLQNLQFLLDLMTKIREAINQDNFPQFKQNFLNTYDRTPHR